MLDLKQVDTDLWRGHFASDPRAITVTYEGERQYGRPGQKNYEYWPGHYVARFDNSDLLAVADTLRELGENIGKNMLSGRTLTGY